MPVEYVRTRFDFIFLARFQAVIETHERFFLGSLLHVNHFPRIAVHNHRHIFVAFPNRLLIHQQNAQII